MNFTPEECREFLENLSPQPTYEEKVDLLLYVGGWIASELASKECNSTRQELFAGIASDLKNMSGHK